MKIDAVEGMKYNPSKKRMVVPFDGLAPMGSPPYEDFRNKVIDALGDQAGQLYTRMDIVSKLSMIVENEATDDKGNAAIAGDIIEVLMEAARDYKVEFKPTFTRGSSWPGYSATTHSVHKVAYMLELIENLNKGVPHYETYFAGHRFSPNTWKEGKPKERLSRDINGKVVQVTTQLADWKGMRRGSTRPRVIYMGGALNIICAILMAPFREAYANKFHYSFDPNDMAERLPRNAWIVSFDVKEFDKNCALPVLQSISERINHYFPKEIDTGKAIWNVHLVSSDGYETDLMTVNKKPESMTELFQTTPHIKKFGAGSGNFGVSEEGTAAVAADVFRIINGKKPDKHWINNQMMGLNEFKTIIKSDNGIIAHTSRQALEDLMQQINRDGHFTYEWDDPAKMLGMVYDKGKGKFINRITSFIVNRICPENDPTYLGTSYDSHVVQYGQLDEWEKYDSTFRRLFTEFSRIDWDDFIADKRIPKVLVDTPAKALYFEKPARLWYKVKREDISERDVDLFFVQEEYDKYLRFFKNYKPIWRLQ